MESAGNASIWGDMQADHIVPWSRGGRTVVGNCRMLCIECNLRRGAREG